jgi:GNAT superfamily N-acetyltransferase
VDITIQPGVPADANRLADFAASTFRAAFAAENRPDNLARYLSRAYGVTQQSAELANPGINTLLAEVDGELAGYAQLRMGAAPNCVAGAAPLELWRFYVAGRWQGRGVAQALMHRVEMEARARGTQTLWLGVWERNERAKSFYRKCGFADVGSQVFMLGTDAQTDRVMARLL